MSRSPVESLLQAELSARRDSVAAVDPQLLPQVDELIRFTMMGGKRLRPQFLWLGWRAAGGEDDGDRAAAVRRAAASLELIQASALIHDDIIDNSQTRRGRPSVHIAVGTSAAILLGDLALAWADDMFTEALVDLRAGSAALHAWRDMRTQVLAGQLLDLHTSAHSHDDPVEQARAARRVNRFKTAAYTVEGPLHIGAALGCADGPVITALRAFGAHVGIAFQLRDDLLGVYGDPAITGKPAGDDLVEGKRTVLLATARQRLRTRPELLAELDSGLGMDGGPERTARLAAIIAATGAVSAMEDEISVLVSSGLAALEQVTLPSDVTARLRELAVLATARVS